MNTNGRFFFFLLCDYTSCRKQEKKTNGEKMMVVCIPYICYNVLSFVTATTRIGHILTVILVFDIIFYTAIEILYKGISRKAILSFFEL